MTGDYNFKLNLFNIMQNKILIFFSIFFLFITNWMNFPQLKLFNLSLSIMVSVLHVNIAMFYFL